MLFILVKIDLKAKMDIVETPHSHIVYSIYFTYTIRTILVALSLKSE